MLALCGSIRRSSRIGKTAPPPLGWANSANLAWGPRIGGRYAGNPRRIPVPTPRRSSPRWNPSAERLKNFCTELRNSLGNFARKEGRGSEFSCFQDDFALHPRGTREDWVFIWKNRSIPHTIIMHAVPLEPGNLWSGKILSWIESAFRFRDPFGAGNALLHVPHGDDGSDAPQGKIPSNAFYEPPFDVNARRTVLIADFLQAERPCVPGRARRTISRFFRRTSNTLATFHKHREHDEGRLCAFSALRGKKNLLAQHIDGGMDNLVELFRKDADPASSDVRASGTSTFGRRAQIPSSFWLPFPMPGDRSSRAVRKDQGCGQQISFKSLFIPRAVLLRNSISGMGRLYPQQKRRVFSSTYTHHGSLR